MIFFAAIFHAGRAGERTNIALNITLAVLAGLIASAGLSSLRSDTHSRRLTLGRLSAVADLGRRRRTS